MKNQSHKLDQLIKKLIVLGASILLFSLYLIYSYNNIKGRSYIYEPIYISLTGDIPGNTRLELSYQTINDPTTTKHVHPLASDSIPENTYIFKIDSSYRLAFFSIYFRSVPEKGVITLRQIKASSKDKGEFLFSLRSEDMIAGGNIRLDQLSDNAIRISNVHSGPVSSSLYFNMRATFEEVFVKTNIRKPEIPSLLSSIFIVLLVVLLVFLLFPFISKLNFKGISPGSYLLALAILILPTGEKICNLLVILAVVTGIFTSLKKKSFRSRILENQRLLIIAMILLLIYVITFLLNRNNISSISLIAVKFGLPLTLLAVALNTNNRHEIELQYAALLTGVIVSVFLHFGWISILLDSVATKTVLFSNPRYYLESSIFSRVHHSYVSAWYLISLTIILFTKDLPALQKRERIIFILLIIIALVFAFARAAVLSLALILLYYALTKSFQILKFKLTHVFRYIAAFTLTLSLLLLVFCNMKIDSSSDHVLTKGLNERILMWENASDLIREKPLVGLGPGTYKEEILQSYISSAYNRNSRRVLNTHNQFLETTGMFGLVVGIGMIWFLMFPAGFSRQNSNFLTFAFATAIIFATGFFFESFLNRNLGMLIFGLCYGLLIKIRTVKL